MLRSRSGNFASAAAAFLLGSALAGAALAGGPAKESPLSMVEALHSAFGDHHDRAVHTKGLVFVGTFTPAKEARTLTKEPIFSGGPLPVIARFSLFAGVPDLADNDDGASPAGLAVKVKAKDGDDFDIEANQHPDFIVSTFDEFAVFLRAVGSTKPDSPHPSPVEQFLATHPHAVQFLHSRTYPASYAQARYWGINAVKFTNAKGQSVFVRYTFKPHAPEKYLTPDERKVAGPSYLGDEIVRRIAAAPVSFDLYAQIAGKGDKIDDPAVAWPATRKMVKLGTLTLVNQPDDPNEVARTLLFLPGQSHPGVEAADPMLVLRNTAYPISLGERQ
ncbi:MAG: catalase family peroxidase [Proteobacteria bacterium]|nr:catalase family peroxidase [Pseudomonadota bacterium]